MSRAMSQVTTKWPLRSFDAIHVLWRYRVTVSSMPVGLLIVLRLYACLLVVSFHLRFALREERWIVPRIVYFKFDFYFIQSEYNYDGSFAALTRNVVIAYHNLYSNTGTGTSSTESPGPHLGSDLIDLSIIIITSTFELLKNVCLRLVSRP